MSRLLLFFFFLMVTIITFAQEKTASPTSSMIHQDVIKPEVLKFESNEYDFGKIPQGKPVTHIFTFTNTGTTPLTLDNVHASCGCTTPEWNKDTIPPGGSSQIKVGYNSAAEGAFVKPVSITYNSNQSSQLIIKGEVWKTPVTSAPENNVVNKFKKNK